MATAAAWQAAMAIIQGAATVPVQEANGSPLPADADLYLRVSARAGDGSAAELGTQPLHVEHGAIDILLLAASGRGSLAARQEADRLLAAFRLAEPGVIRWTDWNLDEDPDQGDQAWWVLVLTVRYRTYTAVT